MNVTLINPADNVAVAVSPIHAGERILPMDITALSDVGRGHKIAVKNIKKGCEVIKYGYPIGLALTDINAGEHVHIHNLKTGLAGEVEYSYEPCPAPPEPVTPGNFRGFRRENKTAGIRNEIWIIPTVGCVNSVGEMIRQRAQELVTGSIDGIYCFPHPYGCSQLGEDHENTRKALCGLINHPNAGAVLVLGLGCENNTISGMKEILGTGDAERVKFLVCQDVEDEVAEALSLLRELAEYAGKFHREEIPVLELVVGLKCGGSDGFSGLTANPLTGVFSDMLTARGGTTILTEVPEMFGAETILMNRCRSRAVFDKTVSMINHYKAYYLSHDLPVYENPSPGNKAGGITTLEDKSLGCTQKSGRAIVTDVLEYGDPVSVKGLNLLSSPGNDLVASTALAVSGAHLILFTTGRGTPFGSPVPTVKISSNSDLANQKSGWIDFDAGGIVFGQDIGKLGEELFTYVCRLASGEIKTKTEQNSIRDMAIFKNGVTL